MEQHSQMIVFEHPRTREKREKLLTALRENRGLVSYACKAAGVSYWFYYDQMEKNPDFRREVEEIQSDQIDVAECVLAKHIEQGNLMATMFYLKTKGRNRGYGEQNPGQNLTMIFNEERTYEADHTTDDSAGPS